MNVKRKAAAVKKYIAALGTDKTIEDVTELLRADEKGYKEDEITEIVAALIAPANQVEDEEIVHFEEWECKVLNNKCEKLKVIRPKVKITEVEADTLNRGLLVGGNTYAKMYFLPGEDNPFSF